MAWGEKGRDLPPDWSKRVRHVKDRAKRTSPTGIEQCEKILPSGRRCPREGKEVDHKIRRDYHEVWALQLLCPAHHKPKTQSEALAGRRKPKKKIDPRDEHPGRGLR